MVILEGHQTGKDYIKTLQNHLLPLIERCSLTQMVFQHDNSPIHAAKITKQWFDEHHIECMDWPSRSPDLNPIENLWAVLARNVYAEGRQFTDRYSLIECIKQCWQYMAEDLLHTLINNMKQRRIKVLTNKGNFLKY